MPREFHKVLVTGLGAITPIGNDLPSYWEGLSTGRNGITPVTLVDPTDLPVQIAGEVKDFEPTDYLDRKTARRSARFVQFSVAAGKEALVDAGLTLRHWRGGRVCPMYLTDIECAPAGRFRSRMVVSMRPFPPADAIKAVQITSRYPRVHGAPVHLGMPERIGIGNVERAWQGDDPVIAPGELPVFWACGVTPQVALRAARPPLAITHTPAHMLVTDLRNASLAVG